MLAATFIYLFIAGWIADTVTTLGFKASLQEARELGIDNEFTRSPGIAVATQFVLAMLLAPVFLVIACLPSACEAYIRATRRIVLEQREI